MPEFDKGIKNMPDYNKGLVDGRMQAMAKEKQLLIDALRKKYPEVMFSFTYESYPAKNNQGTYTLIIFIGRGEMHYSIPDPYMSVKEFFQFVHDQDIANQIEKIERMEKQLKDLPAQIKHEKQELKLIKKHNALDHILKEQ